MVLIPSGFSSLWVLTPSDAHSSKQHHLTHQGITASQHVDDQYVINVDLSYWVLGYMMQILDFLWGLSMSLWYKTFVML